MQKTTFEKLSTDELSAMHDLHWTLALEALETPQIEGLVSQALPYQVHMETYTNHMETCAACQDSPVWDIGCETGNVLAHEAADAMSRQDRMAELN